MTETERNNLLSQYTAEYAPEAILWISADGKIFHANMAAYNLLGYSSDELIGKKIDTLNHIFNNIKFRNIWQELREKKSFRTESVLIKNDGSQLPAEISTKILRLGEFEAACIFIYDLTKQKSIEQDLKEALSRIEQLNTRLEHEVHYLRQEIKLTHNFRDIITNNPDFKQVLAKIEQVASTDVTTLILGETGTGKELIARAIHNISKRGIRPMIKVNCAALPATIIESELFGHEKGAFTGAYSRKIGRFELAHNTTIFLDEIGELSLDLQAKLLQVLQDHEFNRLGGNKTIHVDVRIIAATNRNLEKAIENGTFREDLFYRMNVFPIHVPPLRDRKEDIPLLVDYFVNKFNRKIGKQIDKISGHVLEQLQNYHWPGNVRELEHIIERAVITSPANSLDLSDWIPKKEIVTDLSLTTLQEMEKLYILKVLNSTHWRVSGEKGAAKILGMNRTTLESRMKKLGIKRPE